MLLEHSVFIPVLNLCLHKTNRNCADVSRFSNARLAFAIAGRAMSARAAGGHSPFVYTIFARFACYKRALDNAPQLQQAIALAQKRSVLPSRIGFGVLQHKRLVRNKNRNRNQKRDKQAE